MHRTVTVDVEVEVDLDDFTDDDLVEELKFRGYIAEPEDNYVSEQHLDKFDLEFLIETIDKQEQTWYTRTVRDKLHKLRFK
jgi:hypothetical protein